jgi:Rho GDP-dissociation inhibitor
VCPERPAGNIELNLKRKTEN